MISRESSSFDSSGFKVADVTSEARGVTDASPSLRGQVVARRSRYPPKETSLFDLSTGFWKACVCMWVVHVFGS
jgi:hypothetical protein